MLFAKLQIHIIAAPRKSANAIVEIITTKRAGTNIPRLKFISPAMPETINIYAAKIPTESRYKNADKTPAADTARYFPQISSCPLIGNDIRVS